jgi:reactive intermediate/imine deaminase
MRNLCTLRAFALTAVLAAVSVVEARDTAAQEPREARHIRSPETAARGLPFSDAVQVGDVLYLSGMVGVRPDTLALVEGGIEPETRRILDDMSAFLEAHGSSLDRVFKCTVMLADIAEWPRFNAVYAEYFTENLPARSAFGTSGLALGARVELECWALAGRGS